MISISPHLSLRASKQGMLKDAPSRPPPQPPTITRYETILRPDCPSPLPSPLRSYDRDMSSRFTLDELTRPEFSFPRRLIVPRGSCRRNDDLSPLRQHYHHHLSVPPQGDLPLASQPLIAHTHGSLTQRRPVTAATRGKGPLRRSSVVLSSPSSFYITVWPGHYNLGHGTRVLVTPHDRDLSAVLLKAAKATQMLPPPQRIYTPTGQAIESRRELRSNGQYIMCPCGTRYDKATVPYALLMHLLYGTS